MPALSMPEKVIIIGAGMSGLSVGCYLQMNGFATEIFEMHNLPGGVCTAWKRGGYTFDGCIHWLMGSGPGANIHQMWRELHAVQGRRFVEWDEYTRVRISKRRDLHRLLGSRPAAPRDAAPRPRRREAD